MFGTFSAALLAAVVLSRGKNDGTSQRDAMTYELIDSREVKMTLHTFNSEYEGVMELHGDLEVEGGNWNEHIAFGFCIG